MRLQKFFHELSDCPDFAGVKDFDSQFVGGSVNGFDPAYIAQACLLNLTPNVFAKVTYLMSKRSVAVRRKSNFDRLLGWHRSAISMLSPSMGESETGRHHSSIAEGLLAMRGLAVIWKSSHSYVPQHQ